MTTPKSVPTAQNIDVRIDKIKVGERMRSLDMAKVSELADSINQIGLINPITVDRDYRLIAGLHRLEACKSLGLDMILAIVRDVDKLTAELTEIDENLLRNDLTALEEGEHLLKREKLLEDIGQRAPDHRPKKGEESSPLETTADIAKQVGLSERIAQQRKQIARGLAPEVKDMIRDTDLANRKGDLLKLSRIDTETQKELAARMVSSDADDAKEARNELFIAHRNTAAEREKRAARWKQVKEEWKEREEEEKVKEKTLMAELRAFLRAPTEIELEKEAISAWEAVSLKGIAGKGVMLFFAWHLIQEKKILCPDSPTSIIKQGGGGVDSVKDKIQWLKANSAEARIAWLKGSIARAKAMKSKLENMAQDSAKAKQVSQIAQGFAEIFVSLSPRLQTKFFRDSIKRYHPDKFPADLDEQELQDRLEIGRVLLEAKKFFL